MNAVLLASTLAGHSFDWEAAAWVGAIVAVCVVVVVVVALVIPAVPIFGSVTLGTALTVGVIAATIGVAGGVAAGIYRGAIADGEKSRAENNARQAKIDAIQRVSHQSDLYFLPEPDDPRLAINSRCVLVTYDPARPESPLLEQQIAAVNVDDFYQQVGQQLDRWVNRPDAQGAGPRQLRVYMAPFPGNGTYEHLKELCQQRGGIDVSRVEGKWSSALAGPRPSAK